jgi:hypothetical protein
VFVSTEITSGDVFIHDNFLLCYIDTINWSDIISVKATYSVGNTDVSIKKTCTCLCNELLVAFLSIKTLRCLFKDDLIKIVELYDE